MEDVSPLSMDAACASRSNKKGPLNHAGPVDADALFMTMLPAFAQALENMEQRLTQEITASARLVVSALARVNASPPPTPRPCLGKNMLRSGTAPNLPKTEGSASSPDAAKSPLPIASRRESKEGNTDISGAVSPKFHNIASLAEDLSKFHTHSPQDQSGVVIENNSPSHTHTSIVFPQQNSSRRPSNLSCFSSMSRRSSSINSSDVAYRRHISFEKLEKECDDRIIKGRGKSAGQGANSEIENSESRFETGSHEKHLEPNDNSSMKVSDANNNFSSIIHASNKIVPASLFTLESGRESSLLSSSLASSAPRTSMSLTSMQQIRHNELVDLAMKRYESETTEWRAPFWLYSSGILPCCGGLNRVAIFALLFLTTGFSLYQLITLQEEGSLKETCSAKLCMQDTLTPISALGIGCFFKLVMSCLLNEQVVGTPEGILTHHLKEIGELGTMRAIARSDMMKMMSCWGCMVLACICTSFWWERDATFVLVHVAAYAFTTHVFIGLAYNILYICRGLFLGIDNFCLQIVVRRDCEDAVEDWNIFQAILRRVCVPVARAFILLLTCTLAALIVPIVISNSFFSLLPGACALLVIMWVSFYIGDITSKCDRVGAFINMLDFGDKFDVKRQYVVEYINNSRAGFYMFDVRVTGGMVVKFTYVGFVLAAAVATRILSE